ncbi:10423_t:CDS:2 [Paraglomus occultum]|uniref:10423_t:CDS:1 n=1 Tax=Paraglomus occultum TaxID=144539 RepID=A0A9N8YTI2_9GLOM|nr:10423_t:CDS:2 [Paraglomus occultum]
MSAEVAQKVTAKNDNIPSQTLVTSSIVVPASSTARRSSRYDEDNNLKRRASEDEDANRDTEENKRPRLDMNNTELKKRSQRMFGLMMGTLTKFKNDIQNKTEASLKQEKINQKIQEKLKKEREELAEKMKREEQEKREKIARQKKEDEERRVAELRECWSKQKKNLANFLCTKTSPPLYYLPAKLSSASLETIAEQKRQLALASSASAQVDDNNVSEEKEAHTVDVEMEEATEAGNGKKEIRW